MRHTVWMRALGMVAICWIGHIPAQWLRHFLYRKVFRVKLAADAVIYRRCEIWAPSQVAVGARSAVGQDCFLDGRMGIHIGKDVAISSGVMIWTLEHDPQDAMFTCRGGPVKIGDKVWIGARAILLPGITVGQGAVIGAGSLVANDVEPYSIVGGLPARKIGERTRNLLYTLGPPIPFV
jgi:acetyltransferase-like isoleucine patch superfamily enzyme